MEKEAEVWIGLVGVKPVADCDLLDGAAGAYVNMLAWANCATELRAKATDACGDYKLEVTEFDDVEPFSLRVRQHEVAKELLDLAKEVEATRNVRFGTFHLWDAEQEWRVAAQARWDAMPEEIRKLRPILNPENM